MKQPVIKKGNRYYNTLTKKYVSKSYGQRLNNYFKKNPKSNLTRAGGHAVYEKKKPIFEHEKNIIQKFYGRGFQVFKTKNVKGKTVYYSPIYKEDLSYNQIDYIKKLDYNLKNNIQVELYRMSRDKERIYHIITWKVNRNFENPRMLELWINQALITYKTIEKELRNIVKKYPIGYSKLPILYAHVSNTFYSDFDYFPHGKSFGFLVADNDGFSKLTEQFIETLTWYVNKLEINSYHNILIDKFSFYIMDFYKFNSLQERIARYRLGIQRLQYS